jgi:sulfite reductase (NADPH) hemoprotein beta-component
MNTTTLEESLSQEEYIKKDSSFLRGNIEASLNNCLTGSIPPDDAKIVKFHGSYLQHDRDLEKERKRQKLEPLYQFMTRVRAAGGVTSPSQWLVLNELAEQYGNGTLKLTTRQSFQFHGILKRNLKATIKSVNDILLTTIATCGDVNRNVMCNPNPYQSEVHQQVYQCAYSLSEYFLPQTKAYYEIWLDEEKVAGSTNEEPLYHETYLPRKFKIAFAIPPDNDIDVFANDLGFIAIESNARLIGFNVCVGGGMGSTFGDNSTYPRLATVIGFIRPEDIKEVSKAIIEIQRDFGNRLNRKNARLKYTIDTNGIEWFKNELERRINNAIEPSKPFEFKSNGDQYGWTKGITEKWFYTLFIENGRVKDKKGFELKKALKEVALIHKGDFRLTGNQNLIIGNVAPEEKENIEQVLIKYGLLNSPQTTALRLNSMACVALNTCGLAFAESERYLPLLIDKLDVIIREHGLEKESINIRMTGCPNGCARSALGEIGFVGRAIGHYNLYLGASRNGDRLNTLYKEMLAESEILEELEPILISYATEKFPEEHFGDFVHRKNIV